MQTTTYIYGAFIWAKAQLRTQWKGDKVQELARVTNYREKLWALISTLNLEQVCS